MRRCFVHRLLRCMAVAVCLAATALSAQLNEPAAPQKSAPKISQSDSQSSQPPSSSRTPTDTDQYTLSHERYDKAVSYSRAGYTLYFISYFLAALALILILRLGFAAKFRDLAESVSDKKWLQGLVFVPLLILTTDVLESARKYLLARAVAALRTIHSATGVPGCWTG